MHATDSRIDPPLNGHSLRLAVADPLSDALRVLAALVTDGEPLAVKFQRGLVRAELTIMRDGAPARTPTAVGQGRRELSGLESAILRVVVDQWRTKAQIAQDASLPVSSTLSVLLSNLVERGYLESSGRGYRLAPVETPKPTPAAGRQLSPTEEKVMSVVTDVWQTKPTIAALCGMTVSSSFSAILTNLTERGYLESSRHGYRLPGGGEKNRGQR
jgi:hypothetical protein